MVHEMHVTHIARIINTNTWITMLYKCITTFHVLLQYLKSMGQNPLPKSVKGDDHSDLTLHRFCRRHYWIIREMLIALGIEQLEQRSVVLWDLFRWILQNLTQIKNSILYQCIRVECCNCVQIQTAIRRLLYLFM